MRLVAIYIEDHNLFDGPQTLNFGGKYFYTFEKKGDTIVIDRKENPYFIEGFFDITGNDSLKASEVKVTNVTAIVGNNGAGKTTVLNEIIRIPHFSKILIYETEEGKIDVCYRDNKYQDKIICKLESNLYKVDLLKPIHKKILYYSNDINLKGGQLEDVIRNISVLSKILDNLQLKDEKGLNIFSLNNAIYQEDVKKLKLLEVSKLIQKLLGEYIDIKRFEKVNLSINLPFNFIYDFNEIVGTWKNSSHWKNKESIIGIIYSYYQQLMNELNVFGTLMQEKYTHGHKNNDKLQLAKVIIKLNIFEYITKVIDAYLKNGINIEINELDLSSNNDPLLPLKRLIFKNKESNHSKMIELLTSLKETINQSLNEENSDIHISKYSMDSKLRLFVYSLIISSESAKKILQYQNELLNPNLTNLPFLSPILDFSLIGNFSSGEEAFIRLFALLKATLTLNPITTSHAILLLDEADLGFHPEWKKKYVNTLLKTLPYFFEGKDSKVETLQIIFTTHDPLSLSDIPNSNVVFLKKNRDTGKTAILKGQNDSRLPATFGANISDLLAHSFFIEGSLMGDFALEKIKGVIDWLDDENADENKKEEMKKIIEMIGEPIIQRKLKEMFALKYSSGDPMINILEARKASIEAQINKLNQNKN